MSLSKTTNMLENTSESEFHDSHHSSCQSLKEGGE